jgi:hypothetical protein
MKLSKMNRFLGARTTLAAVTAVGTFAVVAIVVWRVDSGSGDQHGAALRLASTAADGVSARIVSAPTLRIIAHRLGRPVYWAGERPPARLEYTRASNGSTYVRYLTGSAPAGDKGSTYVVVATYAQPDARARVQSTARAKHLTVEHLLNGAVAVSDPRSPRNIHVVFDGEPYQVEVYAPRPGEARRIVLTGAVRPVG